VAGEAAFRELIEGAAVVVLPYRRSSPASGILVRAMHAGRAIVATPVPAVEGVLHDEENALLVPREDAAALAAAIRRLLREPATRDRLGTSAAATAASRFTWSAHAAGLERAYDRAAEAATRR
jgi:glycosyltransferase involved in cell wall biosynthesis